MDKDQERRERAYRIWEEKRKPESCHLDNWQWGGTALTMTLSLIASGLLLQYK